jgi:hypothetical protein
MYRFFFIIILLLILLSSSICEIVQLIININYFVHDTDTTYLSNFIINISLLILNTYLFCTKSFFYINYVFNNFNYNFTTLLYTLFIPIFINEILIITSLVLNFNYIIKYDYIVIGLIWNFIFLTYQIRLSYLNYSYESRLNGRIENNDLDDYEVDTFNTIEQNKESSTIKFIEVDLDIEKQVDCCICLENIETGVQLNCEHILHKECIQKWYNIKRNCPLCRTKNNLSLNKIEPL